MSGNHFDIQGHRKTYDVKILLISTFHCHFTGVFVGNYGLNHWSELRGVMLFASYLTRSHRLRDYPLPVLTISGDLDGLTRITRIVETFE